MTTRKSATKIDPITLTAAALKVVKVAADYHRIGSTTEPTILEAAWNQLPESEQNRLTNIVNDDTQPEPQAIADELASCGSKIQLETVKSTYGADAIKQAWKLLPQQERDRIKSLCENQQKQEVEPVTEQPANYSVESTSKLTKRNLIELTDDLQQLDNLLDTIEGDITPDIQTAVDELLQERDDTNEALLEKLDNYCGLIQSRLIWATSRKAEADRMAKLAESDMKTVDFLKARLKQHLQTIEQKKIRTKRFNISVCQNGGKAPLRFDDTLPEQMPERFQRTLIDADKEKIRAALEQGESLTFAFLSERESHLRIK